MNLSVSNIAWTVNDDVCMYNFLYEQKVYGLEIAPTRIYSIEPYDKLSEACGWAQNIRRRYKLDIPSMQSIWYGRTEKIFGDKVDREFLVEYTKKAIDFAQVIGCKNLVFGNPKNRDAENVATIMPIAVAFFKEIGDYAAEHNAVIALEPNPSIYETHFMNHTEQTVEMAYKINSEGVKVNIDLGAIIHNEEDINYLWQIPEFISHVHISEPMLNIIERRELHKKLFAILKGIDYSHFVSIEMSNKGDLMMVKEVIKYVKSLMSDENLCSVK